MKVLEREAGEVSHGGYCFAPMAEVFKSNEIAVVFLLDVKQTVLVKVLPEPGFSSVTSGKPQKCVEKPTEVCWDPILCCLYFFLLRSYPVTTDPGKKLMM